MRPRHGSPATASASSRFSRQGYATSTGQRRTGLKLLTLLACGGAAVWHSLRTPTKPSPPAAGHSDSTLPFQAPQAVQHHSHQASPDQSSALSRSAAPAEAVVAAVVQFDFLVDEERILAKDAAARHRGAAGGVPEVEVLAAGEVGVYAAIGTLRVRAPARRVFELFTDPAENFRIFARHTASVNHRELVDEDKDRGLRTFEVSKTGRWRVLGIPLSFESTVYATEDWKDLKISYGLKTPGAMKHMSGFWHCVPVNSEESIIVYYNEAVPVISLPSMLRQAASQFVSRMLGSMLEDVREAATEW